MIDFEMRMFCYHKHPIRAIEFWKLLERWKWLKDCWVTSDECSHVDYNQDNYLPSNNCHWIYSSIVHTVHYRSKCSHIIVHMLADITKASKYWQSLDDLAKLPLLSLYQTSASKYWHIFSPKISKQFQYQSLTIQTLASKFTPAQP